jgi:hypothetical protein
MKRTILVIALALILVLPAFSWGIGGTFGFGGGPLGAGLSLKLDNLPLLGIEAAGDNNNFRLGVTADYWLIHAPLIDFLSFYAGPGMYAKLNVKGQSEGSSVDIGLRVPVGLNAYVLKGTLEFFFEWAPTFGVGFNAFKFPRFGFLNFAGGFRFWFK